MCSCLQRFGSDSKAYMPSAYVRGSVDTFKAEATDIVSRSANHGVMAHKDPKTESLAMMGDIATINDIHSAYIHGSIPTAKGESDDIMNMNFPDEVTRGTAGAEEQSRVMLACCDRAGRAGKAGRAGRAGRSRLLGLRGCTVQFL